MGSDWPFNPLLMIAEGLRISIDYQQKMGDDASALTKFMCFGTKFKGEMMSL